jgi:hypothetical protein
LPWREEDASGKEMMDGDRIVLRNTNTCGPDVRVP